MIGKVAFTFGGKEVVATLDDTGKWSVADDRDDVREHFETVLGRDHNPADGAKYSYPADGVFGFAAVADAAKALGGKAEFRKISPGEPGTVY